MNIRKLSLLQIINNKVFKYFIVLIIIFSFSHRILFAHEIQLEPINKHIEDLQSIKDLQVHFINVGQADSILITQGNHSMIIDGGNNKDADRILRYINSLGITKLDYVVGSHGHKDHVGGLDNVIDNFDISRILFPKQKLKTETYKSFMDSIQKKNMQTYSPDVGEIFRLGNASFEIMAPYSTEYIEENDYSLVIKLKYMDNTFLFTADAELLSESEMVDNNLDIQADLLKVGHHGGKTSTQQKFLDRISPEYAVITCDKGKFGYPSLAVVNRLKKIGANIFTTAKYGNIVVISNGRDITLYTNN